MSLVMTATAEDAELMDEMLGDISYSEPGSPVGLNQAQLLDPSDALYHDLSSVNVPETPSPQLGRRRGLAGITEEHFRSMGVLSPLFQPEHSLGIERCFLRRSKRRRLAGAWEGQSEGFVPASSLRVFPLDTWLEAPASGAPPPAPEDPPCSSSSSSSSSSWSSSSSSSSSFSLHAAPVSEEQAEFSCSVTHCHSTTSTTSTTTVSVQTNTRRASPVARGQRRRPSLPPSPGSLSFLTAEEREWLNADSEISPADPPVEIVISDDEEAVVRLAQMEEDAATAQRLQEQFDREETEARSRPEPHHHHHHHHFRHHRYNPYMDPPTNMLYAVSPPVGFEEDVLGHGRRRRPAGGSRRRNAIPDLTQSLQGNDYEALLEFEERQGAVVNKKMSKREIQRFPTRIFQSAHSAGNNQCQICFCDYTDGETMRILPCFHGYHMQCIDRWLKDNSTCPICRANMADSGS